MNILVNFARFLRRKLVKQRHARPDGAFSELLQGMRIIINKDQISITSPSFFKSAASTWDRAASTFGGGFDGS